MIQLTADVWIIVPVFNESRRIENVISQLVATGASIVAVDDGSRDETHEILLRQNVWLLRHAVNCGQGAALQTGIRFALEQGARWIVTFDADGQHDAADLPRLLEPLRQGKADVVLGSRFLGRTVNMPWHRGVILRLAVLFTRCVSWIHVTDAHNGLRAMTREAAGSIRVRQNRMAHASEILDEIRLHHLRYAEVPVTIRYSADSLRKGQSSWNALRIVSQFLLGRFVP
ncbi:MAG TPA: glycosyltransferase family 2 protein [Planctomicrobium sp.]|nr:glycosyltransferase family 2 protein [Planctomicrobium sp.]